MTAHEPPALSEREGISTKLVKAEWTERWGRERSARQLWQRIAFSALGTTALGLSGCIYLGSQPKSVIWPVFLDKTGRTLVSNAPSGETKLAAEDWTNVKNMAIQSFVEYWRSVTTDSAYQQTIWDRTYEFVGRNSPAGKFLNGWYREHNPDRRKQKEVVSTRIISSGPVGENSYQVWWEETTSPLAGTPHTEQWRATFAYAVQKDVPLKPGAVNPFHIFITQIWLAPVSSNQEEK